jgi:hypothetical protein
MNYKHIIPQDTYNHMEDSACGCNPTISIAEGEEMYIHNDMNKRELMTNFCKVINNQTDLEPWMKEIVDKHFWELI